MGQTTSYHRVLWSGVGGFGISEKHPAIFIFVDQSLVYKASLPAFFHLFHSTMREVQEVGYYYHFCLANQLLSFNKIALFNIVPSSPSKRKCN